MIEVTRLNGDKYYVNPHLIEFVESLPDTTITLVTTKKIIIADSVQDVLARILYYRKKIGISYSDAEAEQTILMEGEEA